jgi:hypothetical protein
MGLGGEGAAGLHADVSNGALFVSSSGCVRPNSEIVYVLVFCGSRCPVVAV